MSWIKFLARFWSDFKAFRIFAKFLSAVAVLAFILWAILSLFVDGKTKTAPISYHEQRANNEYKARIHFENLEFLLRSRTIATIKAISVKWENDINSSLISDIKAQNRYFIFTSKELIKPDIKNLGVLSYQISFAPFIKTIFVYYVVLLFAGLVITLLWQFARNALFVFAGFYVFSVLSFAFLPLPFAFVSFVAFALCVICAFKTHNLKLKLALSYISVLPLCVGIGEIYGFLKVSSNQTTKDIQTEFPKTYWADNNITGYGVLPNVSGKSISRNKRTGEIIYDVTYSTNENGWRKIPSSNANSKKCFLFFGDSFTYGEGLNDDETLPFFFGKEMKDYQIFNFGYHGYGPHQALALILSGEVERVLSDKKCESINALYESLIDHIKRANGFSAWEQGNKNTPKFKTINNQVVWINANKNLKEKINLIHDLSLTKHGRKSYLLKMLDMQTYKFRQEYNDLYFAILSTIENELKARLNASFTLFLWDTSNLSKDLEKREFEAILKWLKNGQIQYFLMSQVADDYKDNRLKYGIHKDDLHPNALANEKIAEFLATKIKNGEIKSHKIKGTK